MITLAVDELDRAVAFYRGALGFDTTGLVATELLDAKSGAEGAFAMFHVAGGPNPRFLSAFGARQ